jgi:uncharacterized protein with FMN-binding domain
MEPTPQPSSPKKTGLIASLMVLLAVIVVAFSAGKKPEDMPVATTETIPTDTTTPAATDTIKDSVYKNGTYTATGSYTSPGGVDQLVVSLTLKNDIVTDAVVTPKPGHQVSEKFQGMFVSGYKQYVVGKNIAEVNVGKVSGSSLTGAGFNDAVTKIKLEAKA